MWRDFENQVEETYSYITVQPTPPLASSRYQNPVFFFFFLLTPVHVGRKKERKNNPFTQNPHIPSEPSFFLS
jgi:hypothetical protein